MKVVATSVSNGPESGRIQPPRACWTKTKSASRIGSARPEMASRSGIENRGDGVPADSVVTLYRPIRIWRRKMSAEYLAPRAALSIGSPISMPREKTMMVSRCRTADWGTQVSRGSTMFSGTLFRLSRNSRRVLSMI